MLAYDSKVIYEFAERLYNQASRIIITYAIVGTLLGAVLGAVLGGAMRSTNAGVVLGMIVFGYLGYSMGIERAFHLKLQAQLALCQARIEENTRHKGS